MTPLERMQGATDQMQSVIRALLDDLDSAGRGTVIHDNHDKTAFTTLLYDEDHDIEVIIAVTARKPRG